MSIAHVVAAKMPQLSAKIRGAGFNKKPVEFVREALTNSFVLALLFSICSMFLILQQGMSIALVLVVFIIAFGIFFSLMIKRLDIAIIKRGREIDKDVIFAGRFLLVKLNSGKPLINALFEASQSYGVAGEYFREIVDDIKLGTPLEDALEKAYITTPSRKFRKIIFQINIALKIGVDVSKPLENTLEEITQEQLIEIQRYGKKLNSIIMFYLLAAIVVPSLGITLFSIIASIMAIKIDLGVFFMLLFALLVIQLIFVAILKSIRPNLNL